MCANTKANKWLFSILFLVFSAVSFAKPLVIAHRGASGYLPEHTLEAAAMAYMQSADYIEQDLVVSKDGHLVVLHDIYLDSTTNVADIFPKRHREDGRFYAVDFTLQELKSLNVHERRNKDGSNVFPNRYRGQAHYTLSTFDEQFELISELNRQFKRGVGWYIEIKAPEWHKQEGQDIAQLLVTSLKQKSLNKMDANVYVQCFDWTHTKRLRNELGLNTKLVQLIAENSWQESTSDYEFLKTEEGVKAVAKVANGIGPWIPQLVNLSDDKPTSTGYRELAAKHGLTVHPFTFREDQLPKGVTSDQALDVLFNELQVDGIFTDFTDIVVRYLEGKE